MTVSEQRKILADWLAEWRLEKNLPPPPQEDAAPSGDGRTLFGQSDPDKTVGATKTALRPGDIVLLPPEGEVSSTRPVYVALLAAKADGGWLCAPFSRFSTPATDGEYATGRNYDPLKVVCAWNAGRLPQTVLENGWLVERLGAQDLKILADFVLNRRAELPPSRRGPPVLHPLDPRREYVEEERCLWIDFLSDDVAAPQEWEVREQPIGYAAEDHPEPNP
jgi:hypothetical protein